MDNYKHQISKPILGPNKSPLLGGKLTNPFKLRSINPFNNNSKPSSNIIQKTKNFPSIQLPYVRGLDSTMIENNYYTTDINNIILLEFFYN